MRTAASGQTLYSVCLCVLLLMIGKNRENSSWGSREEVRSVWCGEYTNYMIDGKCINCVHDEHGASQRGNLCLLLGRILN